ncbi:MAG: 4-alpha-glucanotransferase [Deltaproteobacteria bacterium]|nr:4-alpha-glucanotransferase [Deltaproteobacteria bacterium]
MVRNVPVEIKKKFRQLAHHYGVQTSYYDVSGSLQEASSDALLSVLRSLGAPIESLADIPGAWRERKQTLWRRCLEPITVAWNGQPCSLKLRLPQDALSRPIVFRLTLETGEVHNWTAYPRDFPTLKTTQVEGIDYCVKEVILSQTMPWGYHILTLELPERIFKTIIITAPTKAYSGKSEEKLWGVFLPLYALHSQNSLGSGDYSDLEALYQWQAGLGGRVVATLPFLASFYDGPSAVPSPYSPAGKLFWNEFYLDLQKIPELKQCPKAYIHLETDEAEGIKALRSSFSVDYQNQMRIKRKVLEELAEYFFSDGESPRRLSYQNYITSHPEVEDYARFRAAVELQGRPWPEWPNPMRRGIIKPGDYHEKDKRYHLYAQWLSHEQIQKAGRSAKEQGGGFCFDLPLGVHRHGYDIWHNPELFSRNHSIGAPPDIVFTKGQNWGFPPLHPQRIRETGYRYVINYLRNIMQVSSILRIDHVMGLHHLYWIPEGMETKKGVYVRYCAEEFYALLSIESYKHKCLIAGENLGTVPIFVNKAMVRHNIHQLYVVHYELESQHPQILPKINENTLVSINTHDMPPFAAFWRGLDIDNRLRLGILSLAAAQQELQVRQRTKENLVRFLNQKDKLKEPVTEESVLKGCLSYLSESPSHIVLINLEDLWQETEPQNVPGTTVKMPNWRQKTRFSLEEIQKMPRIVEILKEINRLRKSAVKT